MTKIMALETSSTACSVALSVDGQTYDIYHSIARMHNLKLLPMVEKILAEHQLSLAQMDAFAFGRGPGSFTGLRIACAAIKGFAFALDRPVCPVSTLAALALQLTSEEKSPVLATMDARMQQIYWGCFHLNGNEVVALGEERVSSPEKLEKALPSQPHRLIGSGFELLPKPKLSLCSEQEALPRALEVVKLAELDFSKGQFVSADQAEPVYLRNDVAKKMKDR